MMLKDSNTETDSALIGKGKKRNTITSTFKYRVQYFYKIKCSYLTLLSQGSKN